VAQHGSRWAMGTALYLFWWCRCLPVEQQHNEDITTTIPPRATPLHSGAVSP